MVNPTCSQTMNYPESSSLITAVVLSLNGQNYLRSQLAYYAHKPIHLILADGSDIDWGSGSIGKVGDMTWEYFRFSGDGTYFIRLNEACLRIKTPYVILLDDEDCTLWTGITRAIDFLEVNPDYNSAGGDVAIATNYSKRLGLVTSSRYQPIEIAQNDPYERLNTLLANRRSAHIFYQVLRTEVVFAYARSMVDLPSTIPLGFALRSFSWFLALSGKWKSTNNPYSIRRQSPRASATRESPNQRFNSELTIELSVRILQAQTDLLRSNYKFEGEAQIRTLAAMMLNYYSEAIVFPKTSRSIHCKFLGQLSALWIFNFFPTIYERFRPNGIRSTSRYAKNVDSGLAVSQIYANLVALEQLWLKYPNGLSKLDLEDFLSY